MKKRWCIVGCLVLMACAWALPPAAECGPEATPTSRWYDVGQPVVTDLYLSPTGGDSNAGTSREAPLQHLSAAWAKMTDFGSTGYRVNFLPGTYPCEGNCINYFADMTGTYQHPVILQAADGAGTVTLLGGLNLSHVTYLYVIDLVLWAGREAGSAFGNNVLHLEQGDHVLLRNLRIRGPDCPSDSCNDMQEDLKVNQARYLFVEGCDISGAWHTCVDYFSVQYGHVLDSKVHIAGQWAMYVKGGTAYLRVENSEFYDTQLGFSAGQAANLAVMQDPWLHYEVYDLKLVNNVFHDIPGVGVNVSGAYDALAAFNTLYRVATDTSNGYGLAHFVRGERNCTPTDEIPNPVPVCGANADIGGWGPNFQTDSVAVIPNRDVLVANNVFYDAMPEHTLYYQLGVDGPLTVPSGFPNVPSPSLTDDHLSIRGNVIWNGPGVGLPLVGSTYGGDPGCTSSNPDCNETQLAADNAFNTLEPQLTNPAGGDFRPSAGSNLYAAATVSMPDFSWSDAPTRPAVPQGTVGNAVPGDRSGEPRTTGFTPGAYGATSSSCAVLAAPYALPATGAAPLDVLFFADAAVAAACSGAPAYAWTFGDSGTSAIANPHHTYASPGVYTWALHVAAGSGSADASGQIAVSADTCTLDCSAAVPATGSAGSPVSFSSTAYPGGSCQGTVAYDWDFGDGSAHSSQQSPTHTYAAANSYGWALTATVGSARCARAGTIAIGSAPPPVIGQMKKSSPPFKIVVAGSNLQSGIRVFIDGAEWTSVVWKSTSKIQLTGAIKTAVPKGVTRTFRFLNPDGGEATQTWGW